MNKKKFNFFNLLRGCVELVKIVVVFSILMFILYWIQNLTGKTWHWFEPMNFFFDFLVLIGKKVSTGSMMLFDAVFEYKFFIALLILIVLYTLSHVAYVIINILEDCFNSCMRGVRKFKENSFNKSLEVQNNIEQKKIKRYQIYIETFVKPKFAHREFNVDLKEQNKILLEHLRSKVNVMPEIFESGFLFTFDNFNQIDFVLDVFSKLFESKAPVDYLVCVQITGVDLKKEISQLKTLIKLKSLNKITTMADTAYRYDFNELQTYITSQLGVFQKDNASFELFQFIRKN